MRKLISQAKNFNFMPLILLTIFCFAILIRCLFYSYNRPFWNDECALALNLNTWNFFEPLEYNQAAPPFFMFLSKIMGTISPFNELVLRVIPLTCSIVSIFIFYFISIKFSDKKITIIISNLLFAFCYPLCYYAQEFKQYSSDVLCFLLIVASYYFLDRINTLSKKLLYGVILSILIWFSFSSLFALFGIFTVILLFNRKQLKEFAPSATLIIINILIFYCYSHSLRTQEVLHNYWLDGFINNINSFITLLFSNTIYVFNSIFALLLILASIIYVNFKDKNFKSIHLMLSPLFLTIFLSCLKVYPFHTRTVLFLVPVLILLCSKIFDYINIKNQTINYFVIFLLSTILIFPMAKSSIFNILQKEYLSEDIITPLKTASSLAKAGDIIYISFGNELLFKYYKNTINTKASIKIETTNIEDESEYVHNLEKLPKNKTYYWIMAHYKNKYTRINNVYNWAKNQKDFRGYADKKRNVLFIFSL